MAFIKFLIILVAAAVSLLALYTYGASKWLENKFPPLGHFVEVGGERLHYLSKGQGQPIVLLHGASASLRDMEASLVDDLAKDFQVIAFDRPGYGYSTRNNGTWPNPDIQAVLIEKALAKLGVEKPIVVGHSLAGSVVMAYLLHFPEQVSGGILLAGATHPWDTGVSPNVRLARAPIIGQLFASTLVMPVGQAIFDGAIQNVFSPEDPTEGYEERTGAMLALRPGPFRASAQDVKNLSPFLMRQSKRYGEIKAPLLLITAEKDTIVPAWNHAERVIKAVPQAELVEVEGAGHAFHHSRQEEIVKMIHKFVRQQHFEIQPASS
ncbi:MAG: alpha/beta hydrolase [Hyphomicrobiales bacterium]